MLRKTGLLLVVAILSLLALPDVAAQDSLVRSIPVPGIQFGSALAPDGTRLALFENGMVHNNEVDLLFLPLRLIDLDTGSQLALVGQTDYASSVAWSPDGSVLASYHGGGTISLWDTATGEELKRIPALPGMARLFFMPDGRTLAVLTANLLPQILLWDTETGAITGILMDRFGSYLAFSNQFSAGPPDNAAALAVAPDGSSIAVASSYGNIWLWDTVSGEKTVLVESEDTLARFNIRFLMFTADGATLVYYHREWQQVIFVNPATGEQTLVIPAELTALPAVTPDGTRVAGVNAAGDAVLVWDVNSPDVPQTLSLPPSPNSVAPAGSTPGLHVSPDGSRLVFAGFFAPDFDQNAIYVIDLAQ